MKSHIYTRIAEILTELHRKAGLLPCPMYSWATHLGDYTYIEHIEWSNSFYYTGWEGSNEETKYKIYGLKPIRLKEAVEQVWNYMSEVEQVELMATVLGARDAHF